MRLAFLLASLVFGSGFVRALDCFKLDTSAGWDSFYGTSTPVDGVDVITQGVHDSAGGTWQWRFSVSGVVYNWRMNQSSWTLIVPSGVAAGTYSGSGTTLINLYLCADTAPTGCTLYVGFEASSPAWYVDDDPISGSPTTCTCPLFSDSDGPAAWAAWIAGPRGGGGDLGGGYYWTVRDLNFVATDDGGCGDACGSSPAGGDTDASNNPGTRNAIKNDLDGIKGALDDVRNIATPTDDRMASIFSRVSSSNAYSESLARVAGDELLSERTNFVGAKVNLGSWGGFTGSDAVIEGINLTHLFSEGGAHDDIASWVRSFIGFCLWISMVTTANSDLQGDVREALGQRQQTAVGQGALPILGTGLAIATAAVTIAIAFAMPLALLTLLQLAGFATALVGLSVDVVAGSANVMTYILNPLSTLPGMGTLAHLVEEWIPLSIFMTYSASMFTWHQVRPWFVNVELAAIRAITG